MNKIAIILCAASLYIAYVGAQTACPIFECTSSYLNGTGNQQVCAKSLIEANTQEFVYLQMCPQINYTCLYDYMNIANNTNFTCIAPATPTVYPLLPGWKCSNNSDCLGDNCTDGWCTGLPEGTECSVDMDCDLYLYCNYTAEPSVCANAKLEGDICDADGDDEAPCQFGTVCTQGICIRMMSLPIGTPVTGFDGYLACQYLTSFEGSCSYAYQLVGGQRSFNATGEQCQYSVPNTSVAPVTKAFSSCGYGNQGSAYCPDGLGDQEAILNYTATQYFKKKPICHISEPALTACDYAVEYAGILDNNQFALAQLVLQDIQDVFEYPAVDLPLSVAIQDNDACTKQLLTYQYWSLIDSAEAVLPMAGALLFAGVGLLL